MTEFQKAVEKNIRETIRKIKRQGTVGMAIGNLLQITPTPSAGLEGAPKGPNSQFVYAELFKSIARGINVRGFNIYE